MGHLIKKRWTTPLPAGAEVVVRPDGQRVASWRLRNGRKRTAEVLDSADGRLRVRGQTEAYVARYRDARGVMIETPTGCRDLVSARAVLARLERGVELVRSGVLTQCESDVAGHAATPLATHFDAYERHLHAQGGEPRRIGMVRSRLDRLARECGFVNLNRMPPDSIAKWLACQRDAGLSASTRNGYRETLVGFGNWCRRTGRLAVNPFLDLPRADARADRRHQRRALTAAELNRLLTIARLRPVAECGREVLVKPRDPARSKRSRATWTYASLTADNIDAAYQRGREALSNNPDHLAHLDRLGRERELLYLVLATTGLRKSELASITLGQVDLDARVPCLTLHAGDEKNRQGATLPLRADVAARLRDWLAERLRDVQVRRRIGGATPVRLPPGERLFTVPSGLARVLDRDLAAAGIRKRDDRNRVLDVHALRVTFGTHLCAAGVPLRTAQAALRHSKPELTANIYTDPALLDVAGAVEALPAFGAAPGTPAATATRQDAATRAAGRHGATPRTPDAQPA